MTVRSCAMLLASLRGVRMQSGTVRAAPPIHASCTGTFSSAALASLVVIQKSTRTRARKAPGAAPRAERAAITRSCTATPPTAPSCSPIYMLHSLAGMPSAGSSSGLAALYKSMARWFCVDTLCVSIQSCCSRISTEVMELRPAPARWALRVVRPGEGSGTGRMSASSSKPHDARKQRWYVPVGMWENTSRRWRAFGFTSAGRTNVSSSSSGKAWCRPRLPAI